MKLPDELFLTSPEANKKQTLSFSNSTLVLLDFLTNRAYGDAAKSLRENTAVSAMDWRMLVMLTEHPGCSVALASKTIGIDKGAISRSLSKLEAMGAVTAETYDSDPRRRSWYLTEKGESLHEQILPLFLDHTRLLLEGFSTEETLQLNNFLRRIIRNTGNPPDAI